MILGIYGGGALGREVLEIARDINKQDVRWEELVYIIDFGYEGNKKDDIRVLSIDEFSKIESEKEAVISVGNPHDRYVMREKLSEHEICLATPIIHPTVKVFNDAEIGKGVIIGYGSFISFGSQIEDNVCIQPVCGVGHNVKIGENSFFAAGVRAGGHAIVGSNTFIGELVPIRDRVVIGNNSIISMGSVVQNDIPDGVIAMGNPARAIRKNDSYKIFNEKKEGEE